MDNVIHLSLNNRVLFVFIFCTLFSVTCQSPANIPHGSYSGSEFSVGDSITYTCDDQYFLDGVSDITCIDGRWNGTPPICRGKVMWNSISHTKWNCKSTYTGSNHLCIRIFEPMWLYCTIGEGRQLNLVEKGLRTLWKAKGVTLGVQGRGNRDMLRFLSIENTPRGVLCFPP